MNELITSFNNENYVFDFKKEIIENCCSDVDILRTSMMKLREEFTKLKNIDPLRYETIASVCMNIYRSNYMPKEASAVIPEFIKLEKHSKASITWLSYMSKSTSYEIKHVLNGGEKEIQINGKTYKVDGFCNECYAVHEYYDCFWHGCPRCYKPNIVNSKSQIDMGTLNNKTIEQREAIKNAGYNHIFTYSCQLANNKSFQKFAKNFDREVVEPLNPRDAFYRGRTDATRLPYNFRK